MKKLIEVLCCDGCGQQISAPQKHEIEVALADCNVKITLSLIDRSPELCSSCMEKASEALRYVGIDWGEETP
jgi:hypothetical protein